MTATNKTPKAVNYTAEQTAAMLAAYTAAPTVETVERIAADLGKSVRSIVAKLSREGVYKKKEYKTKNGEAVVKKDEAADEIGAILGMAENDVDSLTKANKTALKMILEALKAKAEAEAEQAAHAED